jgi:uncharacterized protein YidB (DUF937 family)
MGLIDILNGMQNGPRGPSQSSGSGSGSGSGKGGGMSPIMMALLGLLAYKAVQSKGGEPAAPSPVPSGGSVTAGQQGGEIGDILGGLLGGKPGGASAPTVGANPNSSLKDVLPGGLGELLGGAAAGTALSGGLGALIKEFQQRGLGQAAKSWVGTGPNQKIALAQVEVSVGDQPPTPDRVGRPRYLDGDRQLDHPRLDRRVHRKQDR